MPVRPYEVVYIIDPDVNEQDSAAVVERFRALAEAQGAQDLRVDTQILGKRRLAYTINHKREGQYVVLNFQSEANAPAELERVLNISDQILRSMVIRLDEMPPEPVAPPAPIVAEPAVEPAPAAEEAPAAVEEAPAAEEQAEATTEEAAPAEETVEEAPAAEEAVEAPAEAAAEEAPAEETA